MATYLKESPPPLAEPWAIVRFYRRRRRELALAFVAVLMVGIATGGYLGWRVYQERRFEQACRNAQNEKQWAELQRVATAWSKASPNRALPWIFLADALQSQHDMAGAAATLENLPSSDPLSAAARVEQSTMYFGPLLQNQKGVRACEIALEIDPFNVEARQRLIFFYSVSLQRSKMVEQIHQAIRLRTDKPENYVDLIGADWLVLSNGYELNTLWLKAEPDNETYLIARAIHFLGGRMDEEVVKKAGGSNPKEVLASYRARFPHNLELICYDLEQAKMAGDAAAVVALLARAPEEAASDNRFWRFRGWLQSTREQFDEAEKSYRKALSLNPFDWHSQHELADVLRRLKRFNEVQWFQRLAVEGKALQRDILQLRDTKSLDDKMLSRIAEYASDCGAMEVSIGVQRHVRSSTSPLPNL